MHAQSGGLTAERDGDVRHGERPSVQEVREEAMDAARSVGDTVASQARGAAHGIGDEVRAQVGQQQGRLAQVLREIGDELDDVQPSGAGRVADLAAQAAGRTRDLAGWIDQSEPRDLLTSLERFARRRPGTFLLASAAAGVVVGRFTRGLMEGRDHGDERSVIGPRRYEAGFGAPGGDRPAAGVTAVGATPGTVGPAAGSAAAAGLPPQPRATAPDEPIGAYPISGITTPPVPGSSTQEQR